MKSSPPILRWCGPALVLLLAAGESLWALFPPSRACVEIWYSRGVFPWIASGLVPAVSAAPFSLSVFSGVFASALLLAAAFRGWRRRRKAGEAVYRVLLAGAWRAVAGGVIAYAFFLLVWGAGYGRERLESRLGLSSAMPTVEDVSRWVSLLSGRISNGVPAPKQRDVEIALASLRGSLGETVRGLEGRNAPLPDRVKDLPAGSLLCFGTSGVTVPFFLEPHVDAGLHETDWLAVAVHELAHVAGYCAEADADFAAAVAGLSAKDSFAAYSVALWLFQKFAAELPRGEYQKAFDALPPEAREDIEASRKAHAKSRIESFARLQSHIYDAYLRSQRLEEGLKEYSIVVRLLVQAERKGIVKLE